MPESKDISLPKTNPLKIFTSVFNKKIANGSKNVFSRPDTRMRL